MILPTSILSTWIRQLGHCWVQCGGWSIRASFRSGKKGGSHRKWLVKTTCASRPCKRHMLRMARARTLAPTWNLVGPFRLSDALVDWLAAGEPFAHTVPMCDCFFAEPPAEQDGPSIHNARKVKQTDIEVFDLHADGIDFRDRILYALYGLLALRFASRKMHDIQECATIEEDAVGNFLQFSIDGFNQLLTIDRSAQQRFEHWQ